MSDYGSPLKPKKVKIEKPEVLKKKKKLLPKSEAKKILAYKKDLSQGQVEWVERWLKQLIEERSLPPQFLGKDAFGKIQETLSSEDSTKVFERIRADFQRTLPLECEALTAHQPPLHNNDRNNR